MPWWRTFTLKGLLYYLFDFVCLLLCTFPDARRGYSFTSSAENEIVPVVKEKSCYVCLDFGTKHKSLAQADEENLYDERFRCAKLLFPAQSPWQVGCRFSAVGSTDHFDWFMDYLIGFFTSSLVSYTEKLHRRGICARQIHPYCWHQTLPFRKSMVPSSRREECSSSCRREIFAASLFFHDRIFRTVARISEQQCFIQIASASDFGRGC